jgi:elongation factor P--beta-lysine ligase
MPSKHDYLVLRSSVVRATRAYFDNQDFLEVHTPRLVGLPGQEPYLDPMWTTVHGPSNQPASQPLSSQAALITSPEYAMKKLLGQGFDKIYDLGPCFRDGEPWDGTHDPEFLLLEWYRRDAGLEELMRDTEEMIGSVSRSMLDTGYTIPDTLNTRLSACFSHASQMSRRIRLYYLYPSENIDTCSAWDGIQLQRRRWPDARSDLGGGRYFYTS